MLKFVVGINFAILIFMTMAYAYHFLYIGVGLFTRKSRMPDIEASNHRFAALICARNEAAVIRELIESLKNQNYPSDLLDIYVLADNCNDNTAQVAEAAGARVYHRVNNQKVGKGYALDYLLNKINDEYGYENYDAFFVFDADNIVDADFVKEMNKTYSQGYEVITSYRNSKNFASNWLTYGYSVWFLYEARFINSPRMVLGNGCAVSGTGFLVSTDVIMQNNGWPFNLLTEDIQFSVNCAISGLKIGYCNKAVVFDEQPEKFSQSWTQRMRWAKGFYQIDEKYLKTLVKRIRSGSQKMTCYDICMTVAPCRLLSIAVIAMNVLTLLACFFVKPYMARLIMTKIFYILGMTLASGYIGILFMGLMTVLSEWKQINASAFRKLALLPTFPIFMATYIPIALAALMVDVDWKPIRHFSSAEINAARETR